MRKYIFLTAVINTFLASNLYADDLYQLTKINKFITDHVKLNGTAKYTTNYVRRGISESKDEPASQATFRLNSDYGIYTGVFGTRLNYTDHHYKLATIESNLFYGYTNKYKGLTYDLNGLYYVYDRHAKLNYWEYSLGLTYSIVRGKVYYAPRVFHTSSESFYYTGGLSYPLPIDDGLIFKNLTAGADIGTYQFRGYPEKGRDYYDYKLFLDRKLNDHFNLILTFTGTNRKFDAGALDEKKIFAAITASI